MKNSLGLKVQTESNVEEQELAHKLNLFDKCLC